MKEEPLILSHEPKSKIRTIDPLAFKNTYRPPEDLLLWLQKSQGHKLAIEIGCGVGFHPIQFARHNPETYLLAIERTSEKFKKFLGRYKNHKSLSHLYPIQADAMVLLPLILERESVDQYFILYPNPYPKNKHKNLRFAHSTLTPFLADTLKKTGQIHFATNIQSYAEELVTHLSKMENLKLVQFQTISTTASPRSHFEKKYLQRSDTCYNITFQRI